MCEVRCEWIPSAAAPILEPIAPFQLNGLNAVGLIMGAANTGSPGLIYSVFLMIQPTPITNRIPTNLLSQDVVHVSFIFEFPAMFPFQFCLGILQGKSQIGQTLVRQIFFHKTVHLSFNTHLSNKITSVVQPER